MNWPIARVQLLDTLSELLMAMGTEVDLFTLHSGGQSDSWSERGSQYQLQLSIILLITWENFSQPFWIYIEGLEFKSDYKTNP